MKQQEIQLVITHEKVACTGSQHMILLGLPRMADPQVIYELQVGCYQYNYSADLLGPYHGVIQCYFQSLCSQEILIGPSPDIF